MNYFSKTSLRLLSVAALFALLLPAGSSALSAKPNLVQAANSRTLLPPPPGEPHGGLFFGVDAQSAGPGMESPQDPTIERARLVIFNWSPDGAGADPLDSDPVLGERLVLNLFDDLTFIALRDRVEKTASGGYIWEGHLEGVESSHVIFVVDQGIVAGKVASPEGIYRIRYVTGDVHAIQQINQAAFPNEDPPVPVDASETILPEAPEAADDGSIIDLMVVYTADARSAAGGTTPMENEIALAVAEANTSYASSGVDQRLVLVHTEEVVYTESGSFSTDLGRLRNPSDGYMDDVHPWRDTYHADNVQMIAETGGCGLAYVMDTVSIGFEYSAFSMADRACLTGNYTLPHELGHNMSARHDWYVDDGKPPATAYTYVHGYVNFTERWRTVMAYNNRCSEHGVPICTRLLYWSNPEVTYGGDPMGVAGSTSTACVEGSLTPDPSTCDADNRMTLNNTGSTTAQFRSSKITWTGNASTDWSTAANWTMDEGAPGSTSPVSRAPRSIDDVFIPTSPTGGRFPTISSGTVEARDVLIETGAQLNMTGGTLSINGDWEEQGTGYFNGAGGTVVFTGALDRGITASGSSVFYNLEIGDGISTQTVSARSDLDVNGNLTIQSGASLAGGSYSIEVAGNWTDNGTSFVPETSTVVFDGVTQTVARTVTSSTLMDEDFSDADGTGGSFSAGYLPSGWTREVVDGSGWVAGDYGDSHAGLARLWTNSTDGWLFSPALSMKPDVDYEITYDYRARLGSETVQLDLYIGTVPNSSSMTQIISSASTNSTTWATEVSPSFDVSSSDTYYLGIRAQQSGSSDSTFIDNIELTGTYNLVFYNLQASSTGSATLTANAKVKNNLAVNANGVLNLGGQALTVDGAVTNNGAMQDTLDVPVSQTRFLYIRNTDGDTDKYYGVDITPDSTTMGSTTVSVKGNQAGCNGDNKTIHRCFDIAPASSQSATVRFWYLDGEKGSIASPDQAYHWNGASWDALTMASPPTGTVGLSYHWMEATGVSSYSPFGLGEGDDPPEDPPGDPTAVLMERFTAGAVLGDVFLTWRTSMGAELLGFNLYRAASSDGERTRLNAELIISQAPGGVVGAPYDFMDTSVKPGMTYFYWLEAVTPHGDMLFEPVSATGLYTLFAPLVVH